MTAAVVVVVIVVVWLALGWIGAKVFLRQMKEYGPLGSLDICVAILLTLFGFAAFFVSCFMGSKYMAEMLHLSGKAPNLTQIKRIWGE